MGAKNRKLELSLMNVIACFLVIFIHCSSAPVTSPGHDTWQYAAVFIPWRLSSLAVPAFYLSHIFVMLNVNDLIAKMNITSVGASYAVRLIATFVVTVGGCILYTLIKDAVKTKIKASRRISA